MTFFTLKPDTVTHTTVTLWSHYGHTMVTLWSHRTSLLSQSYEDFERVTEGCEDLFKVWDEEVSNFRELARELVKKRGGERLPAKVNYAHLPLQERIVEVCTALKTKTPTFSLYFTYQLVGPVLVVSPVLRIRVSIPIYTC